MSSDIAKAPPSGLFQLTTDQWTKPFWQAAAQHRLVAPRCRNCATFRMPPTPFCPHCLSQDLDWPELSGTGVIYSYSVVSRAIVPEMADSIPYVPALVEFPEADGIRLITNIVDVPIEKIRIGQEVHLVWHRVAEDVVIPLFSFGAE
ncbi:Zn-ribbon domain-containing OB-fold protein [Rhodoligotrophos ferricapiens]|uniref:Zn-ribbon domain-containing OB-fold protein n=1 Tax=Rhodoligotrophos ferricapiens TaxID=3069264 RepID=UPI00315DCF9F